LQPDCNLNAAGLQPDCRLIVSGFDLRATRAGCGLPAAIGATLRNAFLRGHVFYPPFTVIFRRAQAPCSTS
jgi:hypothetical protein